MLTELDRQMQMELPFHKKDDALSDAIAALQFMRLQLINIEIAARQCETNLDVALGLLQELAARRAR